MSLGRDIASAVRLLTVVPLRGAEGARPVRWFPLIGWAFGGAGVGIVALVRRVDPSLGTTTALLAGVLVVAAWALLSGMLHWDGLADATDGLGVRGDAARRLDAMRASGVGAYGVTAVVLVALLQVSAIGVIVARGGWWAILAAPVVGRFAAATALVHGRPARPEGSAARLAGPETAWGMLVIVVSLLPLLGLPPEHRRFLVAAGALLASQAVPVPFVHRLGGITGDVLGATVLLSETIVLLAGALVWGL